MAFQYSLGSEFTITTVAVSVPVSETKEGMENRTVATDATRLANDARLDRS